MTAPNSLAQKKINAYYLGVCSSFDSDKPVPWAKINELIDLCGVKNFPLTQEKWSQSNMDEQRGNFFSVSFPYVENPRPIVPIKIVHTSAHVATPTITGASILKYLAIGDDEQNTILDALFPVISNFSVDDLRCSLANIVSHLGNMPPTYPIGQVEDLDAVTYKAWVDSNNRELLSVGPMLMLKLLHRIGVNWESYEEFGVSFIKYIRNNKEIITSSKYVIDNMGETPEAITANMKTFLAGLMVKGKQLAYEHVDFRVYWFVDYFNAHHDITTSKTVGIKITQSPPAHNEYLSSLFPGVRAHLNAYPIPCRASDEALDMIARRLMTYFDEDKLTRIQVAICEVSAQARTDVMMYLDLLKGIAKEGEAKRIELYNKEFGINCTVEQTLEELRVARKKRNKPPTKQFVNKNVGSVNAAHLPQFLDTTLKFENIKDYMTSEMLLPQEGIKPGEKPMNVHSYGVAYGHGTAVIEQISGGPGNVRFYDINVAKNSPEHFSKGDIFTSVATGDYVLDDTETKKSVGVDGAKLHQVDIADSGDMVKIMRFVSTKPLYVLSKVSLALFGTKSRRTYMKNLLFPGDKPQPFSHVRLRKFGKLHNPEVFIELSNHPIHTKKSYPDLMGDVRAMSGIISLANKIIMEYQDKAIRAFVTEAPKLTDIKFGQSLMYSPLIVWDCVLDAATVDCPWYKSSRGSKTSPRGGGSTMLGNLLLEYDDDYGAVTFVDAKVPK